MKRLVVLALLLAACSSDDATGPHPGKLDLVLHGTGSASIGAAVFEVSGAPVDAISAAPGYELGSMTDAAGTHVVLTGSIGAGAVATITVPDASRASAYVVTVQQIADGSTFGLLDPAGVTMTVQTPP